MLSNQVSRFAVIPTKCNRFEERLLHQIGISIINVPGCKPLNEMGLNDCSCFSFFN